MNQTDWRQMVVSPAERSVFEALEDHRWDWRTLDALSKLSGLDPESTRQVLRKYPLLVRQSSVPGPGGEELYTLQTRFFERQNIVEKFITNVSSNTYPSS